MNANPNPTTDQMDDHEWVARVIRTGRLHAQRASPMMIDSSMDAPAEDADLLVADIILCGLSEPNPAERLVCLVRSKPRG